MMCECPTYFVNWVEVGCALAKRLGQKGVVTIVPFSGGKGLFFVETIEEAFSFQELRFLKIKGGVYSPVEKVVAKGKFGSRGEVQRRMDRITGIALSFMV